MKESRIFATFVEYSFYVVFGVTIVLFIYDKLFQTRLAYTVVFYLTLIPVAALAVALPFSSGKTRILELAVLLEMLVALYLILG